jgi:hypothetical protein
MLLTGDSTHNDVGSGPDSGPVTGDSDAIPLAWLVGNPVRFRCAKMGGCGVYQALAGTNCALNGIESLLP